MNVPLIVAAGGYRSGSTLQYNLCGIYVERIGVGARVGIVEPDEVDDLLHTVHRRKRFVGVAKCHHAVDGFRSFERPTRWLELVEAGRAKALVTKRDSEAVRRSMQRKFGLDADQIDTHMLWRENIANGEAWRRHGAFEQDYESLTNTPVRALRQMVMWLRLPWSLHAAHHAAAESCIEAVLPSIGRVPPGRFDPVSLLHWDHISEDTVQQARRGANDQSGGAITDG